MCNKIRKQDYSPLYPLKAVQRELNSYLYKKGDLAPYQSSDFIPLLVLACRLSFRGKKVRLPFSL